MKNLSHSGGFTRRQFLKTTGTVMAASGLGFPSIILPRRKEKLGVALVGLGSYSRGRLAPGLQLTEHCELKGIVTGSPHKIPVWQEQYNIPDRNVYSYQTMHEVADNDEIDIIYIVLPTGLHAQYSIIGAEAGKHVWCEKPMAMDAAECRAMIDAAVKNRVQLAIGYRMQHEPNTRTIIRYGQEQTYGAITEIRSGAGYRGSHPTGNWRRNPDLGGGALYDMGVYPINAIRYASGLEAVAVRGRQWSERQDLYAFVDEFSEFEVEFPGGVKAYGETAFGKSSNYLDITATEGWYRLRPFQSYTGVQGETSDGTILPPDTHHIQARQMDMDALAIKENRPPVAPGEDGLADVEIIEAVQESSRRGQEWIRF